MSGTVTFEAADSFVHGSYNLTRGQKAEMTESTARELEIAGLGRVVKAPPARSGKVMPDPNVAGPAAASSASPVAQASQSRTANSSASGKQPTPRSTK